MSAREAIIQLQQCLMQLEDIHKGLVSFLKKKLIINSENADSTATNTFFFVVG
jgi:hypothetical protein